MISIAVFRERAGAELAKEALASVGVDAQVRLIGQNPYFGSVTAEEYEVRVPVEKEASARAELAKLTSELERAAYAAAGVPTDGAADDLDSTAEKPRKLSWAIALSILLPFPGGGCLYARAPRLGWTLFGIWAGVSLAAVAGMHSPYGLDLWVGAKILDVVLAPVCAWRTNRVASTASRAAAAS